MNSSTDVKALLLGLTEYRNSLENHLNQLTLEYMKLEGRWRIFNAVSEGDYAEQFRAGWAQTEMRFNFYINQAQKVKILLNERIQSLVEFNKIDGEIHARGSTSSLGGITALTESIDTKIKGNSTKLKGSLGDATQNRIPTTAEFYPDGTYEAHHVIPGESANKSPLVRAAIEKAGFDIDSAVNGIYLPKTDSQRHLIQGLTGISLPKHSGYHKKYSRMIDDILELHWKDMNGEDHLSIYFTGDADDQNQRLLDTLDSAIETIKNLMVSGELNRKDMYNDK